MAHARMFAADTAVDRAVRGVGGDAHAAVLTGMSVEAVRQWKAKGRVPDSKAAILLAEQSGVPIRDLAGFGHEDGPNGRRWGTGCVWD